MKNKNLLEIFYIIVFTLLVVHEIDSAYWKEWEMFNLFGGIQLFNIIHIVLIPILIFGLGEVIKETDRGILFSGITGFLGILTFVIHSIFLIIGYRQFTNPVSISIIFLLLITSVFQLVIVYKKIYGFHFNGEINATYKT